METYNYIEPRNKKQAKEYEVYKERLGVTLPQEEFVLKCILSFDWNRHIIISNIQKVKKTEGILDMVSFRVIITAPHKTVDYVVSNPYKEHGWANLKTFGERADHVCSELRRYLTR